MVAYVWGLQEVFQWDDQPLSSDWRGARLPSLYLMHKGQMQPRCWGGYKRQHVPPDWWSNSWARETAFWKERRQQIYNLQSFDCSWHGLQWLLLSCARTSLVTNRMTKYLISSASHTPSTKINLKHYSQLFLPLMSNIKKNLIQLRDFGLKRRGSLCNEDTSSYKFHTIIQAIQSGFLGVSVPGVLLC